MLPLVNVGGRAVWVLSLVLVATLKVTMSVGPSVSPFILSHFAFRAGRPISSILGAATIGLDFLKSNVGKIKLIHANGLAKW